ncbi:MAG: acyltransferase [Novosphingobium sp.]|nr:acyltransferase [Novosphingobium sp.]
MLVASSHLRNMLFPDAGSHLNALEQAFYFVTLFATESVVVFFVLSGLLVGGAVLRALDEERFNPSQYAIDRASRLYVALIPAVVLTLVLQRVGATVDCTKGDTIGTIGANLAYLQNFSFKPLCNNVSLWSLSSEAYCYLLCPLFLIAVFRRSGAAVLWAAVALVPALLVFQFVRSTPLFGLGLWFCGLLPWFFRVRLNAFIAVLPLMVSLVLGRFHLFPNELVEECCIAPSFALFLCSDVQMLRAPLARFGSYLASFSYSLYLIQMPVAQAFGWIYGWQRLKNGVLTSYLVYAGALATMLVLASIFGLAFESRTGQLRRLLSKPQRKLQPQAS